MSIECYTDHLKRLQELEQTLILDLNLTRKKIRELKVNLMNPYWNTIILLMKNKDIKLLYCQMVYRS